MSNLWGEYLERSLKKAGYVGVLVAKARKSKDTYEVGCE
jgi:hypothetical protein